MILVVGTCLLFYNYFYEKKLLVYEEMAVAKLESKQLSEIENKKETEVKEEKPEEKDSTPSTPVDKKNDYIGMLEIPKISLKRGFVDPSSKYNNIEYNVAIIEGSTFPDVELGNFILAAHSGTGPKAIFKDLYKLSNRDLLYVTYNDIKYTYKITKIYTQAKTGYLTIYRDIKKTCLTLITCTKDNSKLQTIYVAELEEKG